MKTVSVALIAILALGVSGFLITRTLRSSAAGPRPISAVVLPPSYGHLKIGMTQAQVLALIGKPNTRTLNARFEVKTPQEWAAIGDKLDAADPSASDPSSAPDRTALKLGALYEHRIKVTWRYTPSPKYYEEIAFDGDGNICNLASGVVMATGVRPKS